ncbi:hypothetical protein PAHAL_4G335900 [Panicum hallii]|uniref:Uncharacterized protein n=1 Tax=Panicum hallii TaxID=206008 RepID=A0A2T8JEZ0_9POAL|nr:hypothetical protein PAHAL_4G335900 [Panicum hallii]
MCGPNFSGLVSSTCVFQSVCAAADMEKLKKAAQENPPRTTDIRFSASSFIADYEKLVQFLWIQRIGGFMMGWNSLSHRVCTPREACGGRYQSGQIFCQTRAQRNI